MQQNTLQQILIISGYSGAGKSVALRALEDIGYVAIDNVPLSGLPAIIESLGDDVRKVAMGCDVRSHGFSVEAFLEAIAVLHKRDDADIEMLFFTCDANVLLGRFKETRRPHPIASDQPLLEAIQNECVIMQPILEAADVVMDSSDTIPRELQRRIQERYRDEDQHEFTVELVSFSYKRGIPNEADLVFDVRFLVNPHYDAELREMTGKDQPVADKIQTDDRFSIFIQKLTELIDTTLPYYQKEGKHQLVMAVGCTGGKHRSVFVVEWLANYLSKKEHNVLSRHRDIPTAGLRSNG